MIEQKGIETVLEEVSGLDSGSEFFKTVVARYHELTQTYG
jgi:hypothetical protein